MIKSCILCGSISHEHVACPHATQILEIHRMASLAGYYLEVLFPNDKNEIRVTWRHNSYNPKNFCSGTEFLEMCRSTIEWSNRNK